MAYGWQNSCQLRSCNYLQNVGATTYKKFLQFYAKKACKKHTRLKNLEKLFDKMVKTALGMDLKSIRKILENHSSFKDNFIKKIADFYGLETEADYQDFLDTFCTNEFINHYNSVENPESDN